MIGRTAPTLFFGALATAATMTVIPLDCALAGGNGTTESALHMRIELEKTQYLVAEPIFIVSWLENRGSATTRYRSRDMMNISVRDRHGESLRIKAILPIEVVPTSTTGRSLAPGEETGKSALNILRFYGEGEGGCGFYLKPGVYSVFCPHLSSDTVSLEVVEPIKEEDVSAKALLVFASDSCQSPSLDTYEKKYQFYEDFVRRYPSGTYTPVAIAALLGLSGTPPFVNKPELRQHLAECMVTGFPESGYSYLGLMALDPDMVKSQDKTTVVAGIRLLKSHLLTVELRSLADELLRRLER